MNLTDLKRKSATDLVDMARDMEIDNVARSRKQEVIAAILRKHAIWAHHREMKAI